MTIIATYKDGTFVPESPVSLPEGARVQILVPEGSPDSAEELRGRYPEVAGVLPREDAEELRRLIDDEFRKVDPDEWN